MEKIKIDKEFIFKIPNKFITWGEFKKFCPANDDWRIYDDVIFLYTEEETNEEYTRRMTLEKLKDKIKEKAEYNLYLKLKEKYENGNTRND